MEMTMTTCTRSYRARIAAMRPAQSRLIADVRASSLGTGLSASSGAYLTGFGATGFGAAGFGATGFGTSTVPAPRTTQIDPKFDVPTPAVDPFRSRRPPV